MLTISLLPLMGDYFSMGFWMLQPPMEKDKMVSIEWVLQNTALGSFGATNWILTGIYNGGGILVEPAMIDPMMQFRQRKEILFWQEVHKVKMLTFQIRKEDTTFG